MATQTFNNLDKNRQEEILQTAYREFSQKGYNAASLSDIIKQLGLAKGSFYRYFKGKKDLFAYLISDATDRRLKNLNSLIDTQRNDFFGLLQQNFMAKVQFDLQQPTVAAFLYRIMQEKNNKEVSHIIKELYNGIVTKTKSIIELPHFAEQLKVFDTELLAHHIFNTQLWLYEYISEKYKINFQENINNNKPVLDLPASELERIITQVTEILRSGIELKKQ